MITINVRSLLLCGVLIVGCADAANINDVDRIRAAVLGSRQMGAHGPGYSERSLRELSRKLKPADMPALIALLDDKNRSAVVGARFGLASQCGGAIEPVYARAAGDGVGARQYEDAREVYALVAGYAQCTASERARATEKSAMIDKVEREHNARRAQELKRRADEDARLQAAGMKMLDPAQRASVSREDCLAVVERNRAASGIKPGTNAESDALFERAKANCVNQARRSP